MSVENVGFPLPVKIEEDQKPIIDLDSEGNSPEDIVIEWHLEMRRFFGSYSAASGETKLVSLMKEYIIAITERAIHFEDIERLHEMLESHMEHIYWFYRDSDVCFSDMYLDYMEHIMCFYVNLTLRLLLLLKRKIKVTQKRVMDMTQKVIKRLSFYLLKSEYHIFHVLIRQTTTLVDGMIKDVINILNSNICKQMFKNLYMHFLVLSPVRDMSDEAFCRAFILFENWKAFEDYKQNEKIDECIKNIFNRDLGTIRRNNFLSNILMPRTSIMSELMKVIGCDPSITKAYFDYIKSKQKIDGEVIDDIGKLTLDDTILVETEIRDEEEDDGKYIELFDQMMGDAKYDLREIVLDCKNEAISNIEVVNDEAEILILDTDSDSDVEIVSIIPSQNTTKVSNPKRARNSIMKPQPVTSFLDSISVDVDTSRRKHGLRTSGNSNNLPETLISEVKQTSKAAPISDTVPESSETITNLPVETSLILDTECESIQDSSKNNLSEDMLITELCDDDINNKTASTSEERTSEAVPNAQTRTEDLSLSKEDVSADLLCIPRELSQIPSHPDNESEKSSTNSKIDVIASISEPEENKTTSNVIEQPLVNQEAAPHVTVEEVLVLKESTDTNGKLHPVCRTLKMPETSFISETNDETTEALTLNPSVVIEKVKVVVERIPPLEEVSKNICIAGRFIEKNVTEEILANNGKPKSASITQVVSRVEDFGKDSETLGSEKVALKTNNQGIDNDQTIPPVTLLNEKNDLEQVDNDETEKCEVSGTLEVKLKSLSISSDRFEDFAQRIIQTNSSEKIKTIKMNGQCTKDKSECKQCDRTLQTTKVQEISSSNIESELIKCRTESSKCETGCGLDKTISHSKINGNLHCVGSVLHLQSRDTPPLDTGQDSFVDPLDTGQYDPNSPASPDVLDISLKSPNDKIEDTKMLRVSETLLTKEQPHGEFGYPTPPGSEEEREKDTDEHADLIYSNILPTKTFTVDETRGSHDYEAEQVTYQALGSNNDEFLCDDVEVGCIEVSTTNNELIPNIGKSYEQIVKDAVGSQHSTEDEEESTVTTKKNSVCSGEDEENISFDEMEQFLKNCDSDDYSQTNRKRRKRVRDKFFEDCRCGRPPKRVKINDKPEMHFIPSSYDEDSKDKWMNQDYDSSSSSENEDISPNRLRAKGRHSPMPLPKYLSKRNGAIPLSGRLTPDKPPPLKGILKRIELKHIYQPLHQMDHEPESVVIVLHQRDIGRGKRGSVKVKVFQKSFTAYKVPFDDHKLCHHAFVNLEEIKMEAADARGSMFDRTSVYEEETYYSQPEKPMYKVVFDKKTPQLNSNDRKYYCDPSISSNSSKLKSNSFESKHEQGTVNLSTEILHGESPDPKSSKTPPPPISPPCFSPSSNTSSEFSDTSNLISSLDRVLQVIEPGKSEPDQSSYFMNITNEEIEKVFTIETFNLLSNNSDFHKMLRNITGNIVIENVPLIGIEDAPGLRNMLAASDGTTAGDDLASSLNSDEQLLKKVCQELESEELVDNPISGITTVKEEFSNNPTQTVETHQQGMMVDSSVVSTTYSYEQNHDVLVSSFPTQPISLHISNSVQSVTSPKEDKPVLNTIVGYTPATIPNSLGQIYSSVPELSLAHANYLEASYPPMNSPTFPPKLSPIIPPISPYHPDYYPVSQYPTDFSERNYSSSNSQGIQNPHQQVHSSISNLALNNSDEKKFLNCNSSPLDLNALSVVPNVANSGSHDPNALLVHSGYSGVNAGIAGTKLETPSYAALNPVHQTHESVIPSPSLPVHAGNNRFIRHSPTNFVGYPQSNFSNSAISYSDNTPPNSYLHALPERNLLISPANGSPSYSEMNMVLPNPSFNVPPYCNTSSVIPNEKPLNYVEPISSLAHNLNQGSLGSSCRYSPSSNNKFLSANEIPQIKTENPRNRLPKEVLTISQINTSRPGSLTLDNNSKTNFGIYSSDSTDSVQAASKMVLVTNSGLQPTDLKDTESKVPLFDERLSGKGKNDLEINRLVDKRRVRKFLMEKNLLLKKKCVVRQVNRRKTSVLGRMAKMSVAKARKLPSKLENSRQLCRKYVDSASKTICSSPKSKPCSPKIPPIKVVLRNQNSTLEESSGKDKQPAPVRKRGRPPKCAKAATVSTRNTKSLVQGNLSSSNANNNKYTERVPMINQPDVPMNSQPRIAPIKIIKDPKSKNYTKVVVASPKTPILPMPVPEVHNFESDYTKNEVFNLKNPENCDNEVEFETHLPLKKRKLSMPVPLTPPPQPKTLANVPRTRARKDDISYPATPMLSIADVYVQPRTFKTPAEKKQLPPESSNKVPIHYESQTNPQFNCGYPPSIYNFGECPFPVDLDCNPYCPPPVLFPPKSFSHNN